MRKFLLLIALMVSGFGIISAQNEITIGNGTSSNYNAPFNNYYRHSWNETIYQKGDIGGAVTITSVSYHRASASSYTTQTIKIYMGETTRSSISSTTDWTPSNQLTLVYSGSNITIGDSEWETFTLNTPFEYSGENNLVVVVAKTASDYTKSLKWYNTNSSNGSNVAMYRQNDSSESYASHPSGNTGTQLTYAANIKLGGEFSLTIGDSKVIDYNGYSLKYTVTSVEPAECDVTCSTKPTTNTTITIPTEVSIKGNRVLVTEIANGAFSECSNLTGIVVPNSVIRIDNYAFNGCSSLSDIRFLDGTKDLSLGYNDWEGNEALFYDCPLKTIYLGRTLSFYGYDEFSPFYGKNLTSLIIGNSITRFENYTFIGNIECLYINDLVSWCKINFESASSNPMRVAEKIYINNSLVTNLSIPANVTKINNLAIIGSKFNSISVVASNPVYDSRNNCNAIIETATNSMIVAHNNTIIPNSVVNIENNAFYGLSITNIHIPNTVVSINSAFKECYSLTNITFEENPQLSSIENYAFIGCYNLTNIQIPSSVTTIGNYAFSECKKLSSVTFEDNSKLVSIGEHAFRECYNLTNIQIPNSVTTIGNTAFYGCKKLSSVTFEDNSKLVSIGEYAFSGYFDDFYDELISPQITNIEIPNSVKTIGEYAFAYCEKLTTIGFGKNSQLTSIGNHAFQECYSLNNFVCTAVNVPVPYTGTYNMLFYECPSNMKISVPKSSVSLYKAASPWNNYTIEALPPQIAIGDNTTIAYNGYSLKYTVTSVEPAECEVTKCTLAKVTSITIPSTVEINGEDCSVTSIGQESFYYISNVKIPSITIPNTVKSIAREAFAGCKVDNIIIEENSQLTTIGYEAFDFCWMTSFEVPKSVTSIGDRAFCSCESMLTLTFEENSQLTSIGSYAFQACCSLTSIEIPSSVTSIGKAIISSLSPNNMTTVIVAEGNTKYDSRNNCNAIIETATNTLIQGCKNTIIPNTVTSIGEYAFYDLDGEFTSIEIPSSITSIGDKAFSQSTYLANITCLAESVPQTSEDAFEGCPSNMKIYVPKSSVSLYQAASPWNNYTIEALPIAIGDNTTIAYDGYSLKYTITSVNPAECEVTKCILTNVTSITIPSKVEIEGVKCCVTSIGKSAFHSCINLTNVTFQEQSQLTSIEALAFEDCRALTNIEIPNTVTSIGSGAFRYCNKLTNVIFGENSQLTSIEAQTFCECYGLTNINLPNTIVSIGDKAFQNSKIKNIELPSTITYIGSEAFRGCGSLTTLRCFAENIPETGADVFYYVPTNMNIQVPENSINLYQASSPWNNYKITKIYPFFNGDYVVKEYGDYSLRFTAYTSIEGCYVEYETTPSKQVSIVIPSTVELNDNNIDVTSIGMDAFSDCSMITSIEIPSSIITIKDSAFESCINLANISIGEKSQLTSVGMDAFRECKSLTSIVIPYTITSIQQNAFYGCI